VRAAQTRLLYSNAGTGSAVTPIAAPLLAYFQWGAIQHRVVLGWLALALVVSVARLALQHRYWREASGDTDSGRWNTAFVIGVAAAAVSWSSAGILLYPAGRPSEQVFLVFVLGGMMLGGGSLLAPRTEAFLAFLIPTGVVPAVRLLWDGDPEHVAMGVLVALFTVATLTTTRRFHRTIESSLNLKFENQDLVDDLQIAKDRTDTLNQQLERRVEARTAELHETNERLRAEITQREQMEEELLRARKLESLGVLAGGIAHDFNNFLTVVQGSIELATMQLEPGAPVQKVLGRTIDACQRAAFLSSQLLTFAKGGSPVRRVVSAARIVSDAVDLARAGAAITMRVEIADGLWSAEVDAGQIGQVLHNILLNAKQAMQEGGLIEVQAENVLLPPDAKPHAGPHVRIRVSDYGCGISADVLPRIFDPYFTTKPAGSGLGLATAYAIVAKHGGRLYVESKYGEGTAFIIDLPASQSSPVEELPTGLHFRAGTGRLLVMDDEETLRTLIVEALIELGYEAQGSKDGAEAIALYEAAKASGAGFDAVLLDLTVIGGMGGADAARRLKELDASAKLIASSGYSDAPVMSSFRDYGFDDVLPKPWKVAQLSDVFRRVLVLDPARNTSVDGDLQPGDVPRGLAGRQSRTPDA
jgi:signal transduction histidine kinase/CheY-like chemotaxis protein